MGGRESGVVDAAGGVRGAVSSGALSDSLDVSWSPGSRILYEQAGNRNYDELDPDAGEETLLTGKDPPGWAFLLVYSPDGRQVAVLWNRRPHRGIWIIDLADRHATLVDRNRPRRRQADWMVGGRAPHLRARGQERDAPDRGPVLSFVGEIMTAAKILKVPVGRGAARTVVTLPFDEMAASAWRRTADDSCALCIRRRPTCGSSMILMCLRTREWSGVEAHPV